MKLLLAEDEVDMSEALVDILTYHKYTVDAVFDGEEALDYATIGEYDGIILDIMMPKMSGLEVLQKLRSRGDRTPVLLLTGSACFSHPAPPSCPSPISSVMYSTSGL
jgi:DNA-binding response OmpR family regulator